MAKQGLLELPTLQQESQNLLKMPKLPTPSSLFEQKKKYPSSEDYYKLAQEVGLGETADAVLAEKGEEVDRIFSGGKLSDFFDILNAVSYGTVGVLKGKSFMEGVRTRESFAKEDALGKFGITGKILGIGLDIVTDPLTYITPWAITKHIPGAMHIGKAAVKATKATKVGNYLARKFIWMGGQSRVFKEGFERMTHGVSGDAAKMKRVLSPMLSLSGEAKDAIYKARKLGDITKLSPELYAKAKPGLQMVDDLSRQLVAEKILPEEAGKNIGKYLGRFWEYYENPTAKGARVLKQQAKISKQATNRTLKLNPDMADEVKDFLVEITDSGYATAKTIAGQIELLHKNRFFNEIAGSKIASDVMQEGMKQLPKTKSLGSLSEKFIHGPAHEYLTEMIAPAQRGFLQKAIAGFKFGKVILNPATHARNMMSNLLLNNMEGMNLANPRTWKNYARASKSIVAKDDWFIEATERYGLGADTMVAREITDVLTGPEALGQLGKARGVTRKVWDATAGNMAKAYQTEETFAKMAQFMDVSERLGAKGIGDLSKIADPRLLRKLDVPMIADEAGNIIQKTIGEAATIVAERSTFNYAQVSPFVRKLRESVFGMPFITFSAKATGQVARTAVKRPARISWIGKVKNGIEQMAGIEETQAERAVEPEWIRDGFYIKLPMKDKYNRSAYLDLSYVVPFGDLVSGQLLGRQIDNETGMPESNATSMMKKAPVLNLISEVAKNQDFFGNKIWMDGDSSERQMADLFRHITKAYLPPAIADQIPGGYRTRGAKKGQRRPGPWARAKEAKEGVQYRTITQEILRQVGLKIQPLDLEIQSTYAEWERKKALKTLLGEKGILKEYTRTYRPRKK